MITKYTIPSLFFCSIFLVACGGDDSNEQKSTVGRSTDAGNTDVIESCIHLKNVECNDISSNSDSTTVVGLVSVQDPIAYQFDYPIDNRGYSRGRPVKIDERITVYSTGYNTDRNEEYNLGEGVFANNSRSGSKNLDNSEDWYNINDVGNFYSGYGIHPGEDWNKGSGDAGEDVYSVADGVIESIRSTTSGRPSSRGWSIVIRHRLPDDSYVSSIYVHTSPNNNGSLAYTRDDDFPFSEGDTVDRGDRIGYIASGMTSGLGSHLHFEIRSKIPGTDLYPNDNGDGYYSHDNTHPTSMTKDQVVQTYVKMKSEGYLDPSDFIDDHRTVSPVVGNGSLISYHAASRFNTRLDTEYPYGILQDTTVSHNGHQRQSGFFQWQASKSCQAVEIDYAGESEDTNITVGHWSTRNKDITFKDVSLPFVVGKSNADLDFDFDGEDWNVIAVDLGVTNRSNANNRRITAQCVDASKTTRFNGDMGYSEPFMIGEHQWNGNASIIYRPFKSYLTTLYSDIDSWPYGVYQDVTRVHKTQYKPAIFYQWMQGPGCKRITIDASDLPNNEKVVSIGTKSWSGSEYTMSSYRLPVTLNSDYTWTVIKVLFNSPVSKTSRVDVTCS